MFPSHSALPLAAVSVSRLLLILLAIVLGYALGRVRLPGSLGAVGRVVAPLLVLAAIAASIAIVVSVVSDSASDKAHLAQGLSAWTLLLLLVFLYLLAPERIVAESEVVYHGPVERRHVTRGTDLVEATATRPEAAGKVAPTRTVLEAFAYTLDGTRAQAERGQHIEQAIAELPEARGKVETTWEATDDFDYSVTPEPVTFAPGATLPSDVAASPDAAGKQRKTRPFFLRNLIVGRDGRWSTSKLQAVLWTGALLWALLALVLADLALGLQLDLGETARGATKGLGDLDLPDEYYLLLGGPFAAAIAAKISTTAKVENGQIVKTVEDPTKDPFRGIQEVISNDAGRTDLFDLQFFAFNLLALGVFVVLMLRHPLGGLPNLPEAIFGLTSAGALAYTTKKSFERTVPVVAGLSATTVRRGQTIQLWGENLVIDGATPKVLVGGVEATTTAEPASASGGDQLAVTVPDGVSGTTTLVVVPAGGKPSAAQTLTVEEVTVASIAPDPIQARPGARVLIGGGGFGGAAGTVKLDGKDLVVESWTPAAIVARMADEGSYEIGSRVVLEVRTAEGAAGGRAVAVEAMRIDDVQPQPLDGRAGAVLTVTGAGLARTVRGRLGNDDLGVSPRSDGVLIATLREAVSADGARELSLMDGHGYSARARVEIRAPAEER